MNSFKRISSVLGISSCLFFAISCTENSPRLFSDPRDLIDPVGGLSRSDYEGMRDLKSLQTPPEGKLPDPTKTDLNITAGVAEPPVPELAEILAAPKPPKIGATQLVSIAVSDDVPLKDVLIELARLADVDIEVDSGITGGVSFRAKDKPFNEVIERIADLAGLRYSVKNGVLRVERDTPFIQTYTLDMLNIDRSASGNIGLTSTGGGGDSGGSSSGASGGSTASSGSSSSGSSSSAGGSTSNTSSSNIILESKSDFWAKFDDSIKQILTYKPTRMTSLTTMAAQPAPSFTAPTAGVLDPNAPATAAAAATGVVADAAKPGAPPAAAVPAVPGAPAAPAAAGAAPAPAVPVTGPVTAPVNYGAPVTAPADGEPAQSTFYSLNRQAGTLMVAATERQHEIIRRFIKAIEANASSQVLIEAKIVEVTLNDTYQSGIDWNKFAVGNVAFTGAFDTVTATSDTAITPGSITVLSKKLFGTGVDLSAAVRLLDEFGTSRALSSPRLNAMNNQQAVLTFAENIVYFKVKIKVTAAVAGTGGSVGTPAIIEVNSEENRAPVGILLSLLPTINKDTDEVTLSVRPTLTRVTQYVTDPSFPIQIAVALNNLTTSSADADLIQKIKNTDSKVPQIETRELDSVLKVKSGQVMVIGGLLEDKISNMENGVPGVSRVPMFGNLFKSVDKVNTKKELIIFIRATIVDPHGNATDYNKALYNKFIQDPEPLKF